MSKLPGLYALRTEDNSINVWAQSVNEHLEVWKGSRGDATEQVASKADIASLAAKLDAIQPSTVSVDSLAAQLATNKVLLDAVAKSAPTTTGQTNATDIANIRAGLDALSRRINESSSGGYGLAFTYVPEKGATPGYWLIDEKIHVAGTAFKDMLQVLFEAFYYGGDQLTLAEALNSNLSITGTVYTLGTLTKKTDEITALSTQYFLELFAHIKTLSDKIAVLEARP